MINFKSIITKRNQTALSRSWELVSGIIGISFAQIQNVTIYQNRNNEIYIDDLSKAHQKFAWPIGYYIFPYIISSFIGTLINQLVTRKEERAIIPKLDIGFCGACIVISNLIYTYFLFTNQFELIFIAKTCNLLLIIFIGAFLSRIKDKTQRLAKRKLIVGLIFTIALFSIKYYDPTFIFRSYIKYSNSTILLFALLIVADSFLPDALQAIKQNRQANILQLMAETNKWVAIMGIAYATIKVDISNILLFVYYHKKIIRDMILLGMIHMIHQLFVYRMIKHFKHHVYPLLCISKEVLLAGYFIIFKSYQTTSSKQILGFIIFIILLVYEILTQTIFSQKCFKQRNQNQIQEENQSRDYEQNQNERIEKPIVVLQQNDEISYKSSSNSSLVDMSLEQITHN